MSTKGTISGIDGDGVMLHVYRECFDEHPQPIYFWTWEQGEVKNDG